jgi:hypothetical protein
VTEATGAGGEGGAGGVGGDAGTGLDGDGASGAGGAAGRRRRRPDADCGLATAYSPASSLPQFTTTAVGASCLVRVLRCFEPTLSSTTIKAWALSRYRRPRLRCSQGLGRALRRAHSTNIANEDRQHTVRRLIFDHMPVWPEFGEKTAAVARHSSSFYTTPGWTRGPGRCRACGYEPVPTFRAVAKLLVSQAIGFRFCAVGMSCPG